MSYAYFQGKIVPIQQVNINPYDLGFLRGYAVFDVMKVVNDKPFLMREHWRRLKNSAKQTKLKLPINCREYKKTLEKLLKKNEFQHTIIRTVLTGGVSPDGFTYSGKSDLFIFLEDARTLSPNSETYKQGAKIISLEYKRELPLAKVTNYLEALSHQSEKKQKKALEIVYFWKSEVLEASTSNIFIIKNKKIITPQDNILKGITRNLVIRLAQKNNYIIQEKKVKIKNLMEADEVFLTASNKDIVPVTKIDNVKINRGKVGTITLDLIKIMENYLKKY